MKFFLLKIRVFVDDVGYFEIIAVLSMVVSVVPSRKNPLNFLADSQVMSVTEKSYSFCLDLLDGLFLLATSKIFPFRMAF